MCMTGLIVTCHNHGQCQHRSSTIRVSLFFFPDSFLGAKWQRKGKQNYTHATHQMRIHTQLLERFSRSVLDREMRNTVEWKC